MGLADIVRSGVALANRVTGSLQVVVQHRAWIGQSDTGAPTFASAVARDGLLELAPKVVRNVGGEEVLSRATATFVGPIAGNGATGRTEPIDGRDRFVLPDGTECPVLEVRGFVDPSTGQPYLYEVHLS